MVFPGHIAGGYLATRALLTLAHPSLSYAETNWLLVLGALAGDLPDIDLVWIYFKYRRAPKGTRPESHRDYFTHAPVVWLVVAFIIWLAGAALSSVFTEYVAYAVFLGSWSHLLFDSIENGVMWLWPFSKHRLYVRHVDEPENPERPGTFAFYWHYISNHYMKRWTFWVEVIITVTALYMLIMR